MAGNQFAEDLREALGAESAGLWVFFMDKIASTVPFLLRSAGRPKGEEIAASPIGEAGFDSWFGMIEAPPERGGLGWSVDSWKAWKRAYTVVQEHPYLRGLDMTASEINTLARELKPFPSSLEELETEKAERREKLEAKRGNSISSLRRQLTESQQSLETLTDQLRHVTDERDNCREAYGSLELAHQKLGNQHHEMRGRLTVMEENLKRAQDSQGKLEAQVKDLEAQVATRNQTITKQKDRLNRYSKMTKWDHFKALFGG